MDGLFGLRVFADSADEGAAVEIGRLKPAVIKVEEGGDFFDWTPGDFCEDSYFFGGDFCGATFEGGDDQFFFRFEVMIKRHLRYARFGENRIDADGVKALLVEKAKSGVEQEIALGRATAFHGLFFGHEVKLMACG